MKPSSNVALKIYNEVHWHVGGWGGGQSLYRIVPYMPHYAAKAKIYDTRAMPQLTPLIELTHNILRRGIE